MKPTYPYWLLMAAICYGVACCGCKKDGQERYIIGQQVEIINIVLPGTPPYTITAIYSHPVKSDNAFYSVKSADGVFYQNIEDDKLKRLIQ